MLTVIQHHQQLPPCQHLTQRPHHGPAAARRHAQRRRHRHRHQRRIRHPRQLHQPHAISEPARRCPRHHRRQPRLAHPSRPRHRHQPVLPHQPGDLVHLGRPAHETSQRRGKTMHPARRGCRTLHHGRTIPAGHKKPRGRRTRPRPESAKHQPPPGNGRLAAICRDTDDVGDLIATAQAPGLQSHTRFRGRMCEVPPRWRPVPTRKRPSAHMSKCLIGSGGDAQPGELPPAGGVLPALTDTERCACAFSQQISAPRPTGSGAPERPDLDRQGLNRHRADTAQIGGSARVLPELLADSRGLP
jgi:hypothetical protein